MRTTTRAALLIALLAGPPAAPAAEEAPPPTDYLTLGQGAVPLRAGGTAGGVTIEHALRAADGDRRGFVVASRASDDSTVELVYALPAPTTFARFAVPNVLETPSPSQTFFRHVEVFGSASGPDTGWELLARGTLATHPAGGQETALEMVARRPVRWLKLRLAGGIDMARPGAMFLEFSELIGTGSQEAAPLAETFTGAWRGKGVKLELTQAGPLVSGCYDGDGELTGTVSGPVLRATGADRRSGVPSVFVLATTDDGAIRGVRSTNGAPFRLYEAPRAAPGTKPLCQPDPPALGCGSVIHGIEFAFDSADLRPQSEPLLAELFRGLQADPSATVTIEGHTSSEGSTAYNQSLSERRAAAVRADLVRRGLADARLRAVGVGETRPIAPNDDESGRALNRRVEIHCQP